MEKRDAKVFFYLMCSWNLLT